MFYVKAIIPTTVTTGHLFWKKTRLINKEEIGSILRNSTKVIELVGKKIGWNAEKIRTTREQTLSALAVRVKKWFESKPEKEGMEPRTIVAVATQSACEESPSYYVGPENDDYEEFCDMCEKERMAESRRRLQELGLMAVSEVEVTVESPEGTYVGKIDYNTARHLHDELGSGFEVSYKEVRP